MAGRRAPHHQRDRCDVVALAGDLGAAGDAHLLLRRGFLEPRVARCRSPTRRERRLLRAEPRDAAAPSLVGVLHRLGRDRRRDAPARCRRADRPSVGGRHDVAPSVPASWRDAAVRPALVPRGVPRHRRRGAVDDRSAPSLPMVGADRDDRGRDLRRRHRVPRWLVGGAVVQRRVRVAAAAPARVLLCGRHIRSRAEGGVVGRWWRPGSAAWCC